MRPDGKVEARSGLKLLRLRFVFDAEHPTVTTNRGRTFEEAAFAGILSKLRDLQGAYGLEVQRHGSRYVVRIPPSDSLGQLQIEEIIEFDYRTLLPVESRTIEAGRLVEHVLWTNYTLNNGLSPELFDARLRRSNLEQFGEVVIEGTPVSPRERSASGLSLD